MKITEDLGGSLIPICNASLLTLVTVGGLLSGRLPNEKKKFALILCSMQWAVVVLSLWQDSSRKKKIYDFLNLTNYSWPISCFKVEHKRPNVIVSRYTDEWHQENDEEKTRQTNAM